MTNVEKIKDKRDIPNADDDLSMGQVVTSIHALLSVTPQELKCRGCKWWKDSGGKYRRGFGAESICPINTDIVYRGEGYCYMFSPKADMRERQKNEPN